MELMDKNMDLAKELVIGKGLAEVQAVDMGLVEELAESMDQAGERAMEQAQAKEQAEELVSDKAMAEEQELVMVEELELARHTTKGLEQALVPLELENKELHSSLQVKRRLLQQKSSQRLSAFSEDGKMPNEGPIQLVLHFLLLEEV